MSKDLSRAIGLINGILHIETMSEFNKEGVVKVLKKVREILTEIEESKNN